MALIGGGSKVTRQTPNTREDSPRESRVRGVPGAARGRPSRPMPNARPSPTPQSTPTPGARPSRPVPSVRPSPTPQGTPTPVPTPTGVGTQGGGGKPRPSPAQAGVTAGGPVPAPVPPATARYGGMFTPAPMPAVEPDFGGGVVPRPPMPPRPAGEEPRRGMFTWPDIYQGAQGLLAALRDDVIVPYLTHALFNALPTGHSGGPASPTVNVVVNPANEKPAAPDVRLTGTSILYDVNRPYVGTTRVTPLSNVAYYMPPGAAATSPVATTGTEAGATAATGTAAPQTAVTGTTAGALPGTAAGMAAPPAGTPQSANELADYYARKLPGTGAEFVNWREVDSMWPGTFEEFDAWVDAFTHEHGYPPWSGSFHPTEVLRENVAARDWGMRFMMQNGRPPTEEEYKSEWYANRFGLGPYDYDNPAFFGAPLGAGWGRFLASRWGPHGWGEPWNQHGRGGGRRRRSAQQGGGGDYGGYGVTTLPISGPGMGV